MRAPSAAGAITFQGAALSRSWESRQHCKDLCVRDTATSGSREFSLSVDLILKAQNCFPTRFSSSQALSRQPLANLLHPAFLSSSPNTKNLNSCITSPVFFTACGKTVCTTSFSQARYFLAEERSNLDK